jgi:hypothetical protein
MGYGGESDEEVMNESSEGEKKGANFGERKYTYKMLGEVVTSLEILGDILLEDEK